MLIVTATIRAQPQHAETLHAVMTRLALDSRKETGCNAYRVFRAMQDPALFSTFEEWTNAAAEQRHMASAHVAEAFQAATPLLAAPPEFRRFVEI